MKLYLIKFSKNGIIKDKSYLLDQAIGGKNCRPIILITYDKYTFLVNNGI